MYSGRSRPRLKPLHNKSLIVKARCRSIAQQLEFMQFCLVLVKALRGNKMWLVVLNRSQFRVERHAFTILQICKCFTRRLCLASLACVGLIRNGGCKIVTSPSIAAGRQHYLMKSLLSVIAILPIATQFSVAWTVCHSVCLSSVVYYSDAFCLNHLMELLMPFGRYTSLVGSSDTVRYSWEFLTPKRKEKFGC